MAEPEQDVLPLDEALDHLAGMLRNQLTHTRAVIDAATQRRAEISQLNPEQRSEELVTRWNDERQAFIQSINDPWERIIVFMGRQFVRHERQPDRQDIHALSGEIYQLGAELSSVLWSIIDGNQGSPADHQSTRRRGEGLPHSLAQQTFQEMRNLGIALSDGPSGRRWQDVAGELAMVHAVPDQPIFVKFSPSSLMLDWLASPPTYAHLHNELKAAGAPAVLLAHVVVGLILERGKSTWPLADLRRAIGWTRRESSVIDEQLRRVWRMLLLLSSMPVIGKRPGRYRDPRTKQVIDLVSRDPLIVVRGERYAAGDPAGQNVPLDVSLDGGAWIDQYRGNRHILSDFGDVLRLAAIPAGKPSGAWAQSIGLALNQRWRERAHDATVANIGDDRRETVRFKPFARGDLLDLFRADPYYRDVLTGEHPRRAQAYWDDAIKLLRHEGIIGHYAELQPPVASRQGWQDDWLRQPLDIRPAEDGRRDVAEISRAAVAAKRSRRKQKA